MKNLSSIVVIIIMMASFTLTSCTWNSGRGDIRDRNIEKAMLARLDTLQGVQYFGLSDTHDLEDGKFQAVVIYNVLDSVGNHMERNARITTNLDGSEIYSWEDLDCQVLRKVKQKVTYQLKEKGINIDSSLIDALIELKRH